MLPLRLRIITLQRCHTTLLKTKSKVAVFMVNAAGLVDEAAYYENVVGLRDALPAAVLAGGAVPEKKLDINLTPSIIIIPYHYGVCSPRAASEVRPANPCTYSLPDRAQGNMRV